MTVPNKPAPLRLLLPLAAALAVVACKPAEDPAAIAARQKAAIEQAAGALGISDLNPDTADHEF